MERGIAGAVDLPAGERLDQELHQFRGELDLGRRCSDAAPLWPDSAGAPLVRAG